ncbi:MAG TPA: hypothetical protein VHN14_11870 [Kofleriaceae bacterium]|nr:hypothetical protein [Kofleriaceae bacterium]
MQPLRLLGTGTGGEEQRDRSRGGDRDDAGGEDPGPLRVLERVGGE